LVPDIGNNALNHIELLCTGTERQWTLVFRPLTDAEEEDGYQIICDTVEWLRSKDIALWRKPLPREVYAARQQRGENYGLFAEGQLAAIVSLVAGVPEYWAAEVADRAATWLCTLATATKFRRHGLGRQAVQEALRPMHGRRVYLDCRPGFLDEFYRALGFKPLHRKSLTLEHGQCGCFEAMLMQWEERR
jgi:GNAT superfamily N-acetyltransferase